MKFIFIFFLLFAFGSSEAQLTNTTWKGMFNVPYPMECNFAFGADTATLYMSDGSGVVETMKYRVSNDSVFIVKLSGESPCYDEKEAIYSYKITDQELMLVALEDNCEERSNAFPTEGMEMIKP